eukprot:Trichotokara_eunicae@DN5311_c0_g2_i1.p1
MNQECQDAAGFMFSTAYQLWTPKAGYSLREDLFNILTHRMPQVVIGMENWKLLDLAFELQIVLSSHFKVDVKRGVEQTFSDFIQWKSKRSFPEGLLVSSADGTEYEPKPKEIAVVFLSRSTKERVSVRIHHSGIPLVEKLDYSSDDVVTALLSVLGRSA